MVKKYSARYSILQIWAHLLKKFLMEYFIICVVLFIRWGIMEIVSVFIQLE